MTNLKRISLVLALGASLAAAGCGSDDEGEPIPAEQADALLAELDGVQRRLEQGSAGACRDVFSHPTDPNQRRVEDALASLPDDVDPDVRSALEQSFGNLWDLVQSECEERAAQEQEAPPEQPETTAPEPEPEPEPETTPTEPEPEPLPEEPTPTDPDEAPIPPDGDGESGGAIPEGNGGGVGQSFGQEGGG